MGTPLPRLAMPAGTLSGGSSEMLGCSEGSSECVPKGKAQERGGRKRGQSKGTKVGKFDVIGRDGNLPHKPPTWFNNQGDCSNGMEDPRNGQLFGYFLFHRNNLRMSTLGTSGTTLEGSLKTGTQFYISSEGRS